MSKTKLSLALDSMIVRNAALPATPVDGDLVILNLASGNYIGLDDIGRRIWELLETPHRIDDLCAVLREEYRGPADAIACDVLDFLAELAAEGMIAAADA